MHANLAIRHAWEVLLVEERELCAYLGYLSTEHAAQLDRPAREMTATISAIGQLLGFAEAKSNPQLLSTELRDADEGSSFVMARHRPR